jgi:hypothetical protein
MSKYGLALGDPELKSVGALAFGPEGILFVADNITGAVVAIDVADETVAEVPEPVEVDELDSRIAGYLGIDRSSVAIRGLAVHPDSHAVYLSVTRGQGAQSQPVLVRIDASGELSSVATDSIPFARIILDDAPSETDERQDVSLDGSHGEAENVEYNGVKLSIARFSLRTSTITDLAWIDGTVLVAGASNEEFASTLRRIPFPFGSDVDANSLEIFHVSHGKWETASPIRTFVPFGGNTSVLASYTCTPLVHFPLTDLAPGTKAVGRTVAELGAMNQPLDIVSYRNDGQEYLLVSNTRHPLLKIAATAIDAQQALTEPTEPIGVERDELPHDGVSLMANLDEQHVLMLQRDGNGGLALHSYHTDSL